MAKDGKKKEKGKAKAKLPKEVGGVKVPKRLRKIGDRAVKAASNPVVSEVVAGALLAAAAALRQGKDPKTGSGAGAQGAAGGGGRGGRGAGEDVAEVKRQAVRLSDSLKVLAIDLARRTLEGIEDGQRAKRRRRDSDAAPGSDGGGPGRG